MAYKNLCNLKKDNIAKQIEGGTKLAKKCTERNVTQLSESQIMLEYELTTEILTEFKDVFSMFKNKMGVLTLSSFAEVLCALGWTGFTEKVIVHNLRHLDLLDNEEQNSITFTTFLVFVGDQTKQGMAQRDCYILTYLKAFDGDGDGFISMSELSEGLYNWIVDNIPAHHFMEPHNAEREVEEFIEDEDFQKLLQKCMRNFEKQTSDRRKLLSLVSVQNPKLSSQVTVPSDLILKIADLLKERFDSEVKAGPLHDQVDILTFSKLFNRLLTSPVVI